MPEYGIVIQARTRASRLPDKVLLPFYRGRSILEIITANLLNACRDIPVYIATSTHPSDDRIADMALGLGVGCVRGDEQDVLSRFLLTGNRHALQHIVRVCADNPFLDAGATHTMATLHAAMRDKPDYYSYALAPGLPAIKSHIGIYPEIARFDALKKIPGLTEDPLYFEHVTNFLYAHPEMFHVHLEPAPPPVYGRTDLRLTIDTREDFDLLQEIYAETRAGRQGISAVINYLDRRKDILEKMRNLIAGNEK